ncbi:hypothetical protein PCANC_13183 [Puccinia coronata f. sp. avenae]|uniref:Uncharacterized protein n=1 Tax=Puccinia coronata f. sp. avenae TaxID=200324 RepID=A0A2N5SMT3_9BASI|nr:hypothetical protein PCASD_20400 [Puccinia coronata f. sp. avenae]PLW41690.1 hypothetical protein PCANC_13183 [Puccinia coronata f. sp. avenae]
MDTAVDISGGGLDLTRTVNEAQDLAKMNEESRSALQASKLNEANPPTGQQPSATAEISAIRNRHNPTLNRSPFWTTPHGKLFPSVKMRLQRLPHNKKVEWLEDQLYQRAPDKLSVKSHDAAADRFSRKPEEKPPYGSRKLLKPFVQWWQTRHEIPVQELADELEKADPTRLSEHHFSQALGLDDETPASKGLFAKMKFPKIRTQKTPSPTTPIQVGDDKEDVIEGSQSSARVKRLVNLFSWGKTKMSDFFRERKALSLADELYKVAPEKLTPEARTLSEYRWKPPLIKFLMWLGLKPETWGSRLSNQFGHYSWLFKTKWNNSRFGKTWTLSPKRHAPVVTLAEPKVDNAIMKVLKQNPLMKKLKQWNQNRRDKKVKKLFEELRKVDQTKLLAPDDPPVPNYVLVKGQGTVMG